MVSAPFDIGTLIDSNRAGKAGTPYMEGTGITVHTVAAAYREGLSIEEMLEQLPTDAAHVHAAIAYYLANRDAIDAELDTEDALYRELAARYPAGVRGEPF